MIVQKIFRLHGAREGQDFTPRPDSEFRFKKGLFFAQLPAQDMENITKFLAQWGAQPEDVTDANARELQAAHGIAVGGEALAGDAGGGEPEGEAAPGELDAGAEGGSEGAGSDDQGDGSDDPVLTPEAEAEADEEVVAEEVAEDAAEEEVDEEQAAAAAQLAADREAEAAAEAAAAAAPPAAEPETTDGMKAKRVAAALLQLDPDTDSHWTKTGLPAIEAVEAIIKEPTTRAVVQAAGTDFTREKAAEIKAALNKPIE